MTLPSGFSSFLGLGILTLSPETFTRWLHVRLGLALGCLPLVLGYELPLLQLASGSLLCQESSALLPLLVLLLQTILLHGRLDGNNVLVSVVPLDKLGLLLFGCELLALGITQSHGGVSLLLFVQLEQHTGMLAAKIAVCAVDNVAALALGISYLEGIEVRDVGTLLNKISINPTVKNLPLIKKNNNKANHHYICMTIQYNNKRNRSFCQKTISSNPYSTYLFQHLTALNVRETIEAERNMSSLPGSLERLRGHLKSDTKL